MIGQPIIKITVQLYTCKMHDIEDLTRTWYLSTLYMLYGRIRNRNEQEYSVQTRTLADAVDLFIYENSK